MNRVMEESLKSAREHEQRFTGLKKGGGILASGQQQLNEDLLRYEPLNPDQRLRQELEPMGLKNVGNSKFTFDTIKSMCSLLF